MHIENRSGTHVVVYEDESCHPANDDEITMWAELTAIRAENEKLKKSLKRSDDRADRSHKTIMGLGSKISCLQHKFDKCETRHTALREAVRPVVEWWTSSPDGIPMRLGATEIMGLMTRKEASFFDALAALVGEEGK